MVALRNLDPLFGANQLLAQANSFFGQTWDPSREIDFNKMVDTENQYDIRSAQAEQAQLQSEYRNRMKEGMQGANSLEDVYRLKAQAAKELGLDSEYEKALQEQQDEDIRKQQRELPENTTLSARVDALQRAYLQNGDLDKALKIRPQNESKFFSYRGGITAVDPTTGEVKVLSAPEARAEGEGGTKKLARFMYKAGSPNSGEIIVVDASDRSALESLPANVMNMNHADTQEGNLQVQMALEDRAQRDALRQQQAQAAQGQPTPTPNPVSSVNSIKQGYEQLMGQGSGPRYEERKLKNGQRVRVLLGR